MFTVFLDNGHGSNTAGKRSPDGRFREYAYARKVVAALAPKLKAKGINVVIVTPEDYDVSLYTRTQRINKEIAKLGAKNCLMISVHNNAAGMGNWMSARGWSAWTTRGQNNSDVLAECLYDAAEKVFLNNAYIKESFKGEKVYKPILTQMIDGDRDYESNFAIIKGANCPAVLVENFFQDNKKDLVLLESNEGFNAIVEVLLKGIISFINLKTHGSIQ
jgi:N-acetylmuramoyl-L-alanine amidase